MTKLKENINVLKNLGELERRRANCNVDVRAESRWVSWKAIGDE